MVKDDSGSYAVFTEQGPSSLTNDGQQKSWISYPDCQGAQGQAARRSISYTRVKMEDAPKLWKIPKSECPDMLDGPVWKTESFLLSGIRTVIFWQDCNVKGNLRKSYWSTVGRRFPTGNAYSYTVKKFFFICCMWMTWKLAGKKQNLDPMWKVLNKEVDLGEPTSFLDHVIPGKNSQTMWKTQKILWTSTEPCLNREFQRVEQKNFHTLRIFVSLHGLLIWTGHAKKCVERYCELANKTTQQLYKVSTPCIDDHHFKEEEMKSVGELSNVCLSNCSKMLILGTNWTTRYSMVSK